MEPPFIWFGGKRRVADEVWRRFGVVDHYIEPFAGGAAVFLANPRPDTTETLNDADCYITNCWRSIKHAPERVAQETMGLVSEADIYAINKRLINCRDDVAELMRHDHEVFDYRYAAWWLVGVCWWLGRDWARRNDRRIPCFSSRGRGLMQCETLEERMAWLSELSARLARVRVACGDWSRVLTPAITKPLGTTAVFLDPPYADDRHSLKYGGGGAVWGDVVKWCEKNGRDKNLRIAVCGYRETWDAPDGWAEFVWTSSAGWGTSGEEARAMAATDTIWFSPSCKKEASLF